MIAREEFDNVIRTARKIGISYSDLMEMDIRKFNQSVEGYIDAREEQLNDSAIIAHREALKIVQGIFGSKNFSDTIADFRLRPKTDEEIMQEKINAFRALVRGGV